MRRFLGILVALLLGLTAAVAQTDGNEPQEGVVFERLHHDFGVMNQGGERVSYEFRFTNHSEAPLIITRTTNSCRCISVSSPKRPVGPGESGSVKVTFDPKDRGVFNKSIEVFANIPGGRVTLLVSGEVK